MAKAKIFTCLLALFVVFVGSLNAQEIKTFLDGVELKNVQAREIDGYIMLPAEEIFKVLDVELKKDETTENWKVKTKSSRAMLFYINQSYIRFNTDMFTVNGPNNEYKKLDSTPKYVDGKLFISFGAIIDEVFDCVATLDSEKRQIDITTTAKESKKREKGREFEIKLCERYDDIFEFPGSEDFLATRQKRNHLIGIRVVTLTKFDKEGNTLWHKDLSDYRPSVPFDLEPSIEMVTFADGKFITSISSKIVKFDAECNTEWVCDMIYPVERKLFATENGDIITLEGTVEVAKSSDGTAYYRQNNTSLVLTKIDDTGQIVAKKVLGGQGRGNIILKKATYDKDAGLVIMCSTSFLDGDFVMAKSNKNSSDFVASIDPDNFEIRFIFGHIAKEDNIYSEMTCRDFFVFNGLIHIIFEYYDTEKGTLFTFMSQATKEGREIWRVDLRVSWYMPKLTVLADGIFMAYVDNGMSIQLSLLNQQGDILKTAELERMTKYQRREVGLISTNDGGFISMQILEGRNISTNLCFAVPPKDSETLATKYDKNFNVVWQKKYNLHEDTSSGEMVFPTATGLLIVE